MNDVFEYEATQLKHHKFCKIQVGKKYVLKDQYFIVPFVILFRIQIISYGQVVIMDIICLEELIKNKTKVVLIESCRDCTTNYDNSIFCTLFM